jgi:predicted peptidase
MTRRFAASLPLWIALSACAHDPSAVERVTGIAPLARDAVSSVDTALFESGRFTAADGTVVPYRLLRPLAVRNGQRYPLVIQFHGSGGIGTDNVSQLDRLARSWAMPQTRARYPAYILVPQFPIRSANYGPASPEQAAQASPALVGALELARDFASTQAVDASRIYAVGFSMGGSAAWLAPTLDPAMFAAIVPIAGIAPADGWAGGFKDVPVLALHGTADEENPITADRRFVHAIQVAGGQRIRLREYEGLDHQPPADIHPGLWWRDWLFQQTRNGHR